jgi:hypothetical protein
LGIYPFIDILHFERRPDQILSAIVNIPFFGAGQHRSLWRNLTDLCVRPGKSSAGIKFLLIVTNWSIIFLIYQHQSEGHVFS